MGAIVARRALSPSSSISFECKLTVVSDLFSARAGASASVLAALSLLPDRLHKTDCHVIKTKVVDEVVLEVFKGCRRAHDVGQGDDSRGRQLYVAQAKPQHTHTQRERLLSGYLDV